MRKRHFLHGTPMCVVKTEGFRTANRGQSDGFHRIKDSTIAGQRMGPEVRHFPRK